MKIKFKSILALLVLTGMISCSKQKPPVCEGLNWKEMPAVGYLDEYYDFFFSFHDIEIMYTCDCESLLTIQEFDNEHLPDFMPGFMPMNMTCEELQESCVTDQELIEAESEEILNLLTDDGLISEAERIIMTEFFGEVFAENSNIDYDDYRCQIELADKSSVDREAYRGYLNTLTINIFQGDIEYLQNSESLKKKYSIQERWRLRLILRAGKKYVKAMKTAWDERYNPCDSCFGEAVFDELED